MTTLGFISSVLFCDYLYRWVLAGTAKNPYSQFLNFNISHLVSHGSATRFLRNGEKYYIYFVDDSEWFPTLTEFSKSVNS